MPETIQPVERREWWPSVYMDETIPHGRPTPDAWLTRLDDGAHGFGDRTDEMAPVTALTEGQVVEFDCCDDLGTSLLTEDDEGNAIWLPEPPESANHFWLRGDVDTICDSVELFEEQARDFGHVGEVVTISRWSISEFRCRFTALDGPPRFVPLDAVPIGPDGAVSAPAGDAQGDLALAPSLATEV